MLPEKTKQNKALTVICHALSALLPRHNTRGDAKPPRPRWPPLMPPLQDRDFPAYVSPPLPIRGELSEDVTPSSDLPVVFLPQLPGTEKHG
jgi:hypothetical protein